MIETSTNAAGRLWLAMEAFKVRPSEENARFAWAEVFGVDHATPWPVLRASSVLVADSMEIPRLIEPLNPPGNALRYWSSVEQLLFKFGSVDAQNVGTFKQEWTQHVADSVETCDHLLRQTTPRTSLSSDKVEDCKVAAQALYDAVNTVPADGLDVLGVEARVLLTRHIEEIQRVLNTLHIYGPERLDDATDALVGAITRHPTIWQRITDAAINTTVNILVASVIAATGWMPATGPAELPAPPPVTIIIQAPTSLTDGLQLDEGNVIDAEIVDDAAQADRPVEPPAADTGASGD
jgi:hypothetical protein